MDDRPSSGLRDSPGRPSTVLQTLPFDRGVPGDQSAPSGPPASQVGCSTPWEQAVIECRNLTKVYGNHVALNNLNLKLSPGDAFGFIGPNGAGKTTTIRILATLLEPTRGEAFVGGYSVLQEPDEVRRILGYMPDQFGIYDGMRASEYLDFFAAAYRVPKVKRQGLIKDVLEITDLTQKRDSFVESLSTGMKQRLCLAKTLLHDPQVLLLDEPASGLDPRARIELKELIRELSRMGKTLCVSSHILPELADF